MSAGETDLLRALTLLIHDLRAPLSVASGYLRLIRDERLTSDEDRERALVGTIEAVRRMSRLCDEASDFGAVHTGGEHSSTTLVTTEELATRVRSALEADGTTVEARDLGSSSYVRVAGADRIATAIASVLRARSRAAANADPVAVDMVANDKGLWFLVGTASQRQELTKSDGMPFDPWGGGHGLQLPLACRYLQQVDGRVWTTASSRAAIGVRFPLEAQPS